MLQIPQAETFVNLFRISAYMNKWMYHGIFPVPRTAEQMPVGRKLSARKAKGNNYLSSDGGSFNKGGLIPFTQNVYRGLLRSFLPFL